MNIALKRRTPTNDSTERARRRGAFPTSAAWFAASAAAIATLTACGSATEQADNATKETGWQESASASKAGVSPVLLLGDSVAAGEAAPLNQALAASGGKFVNATTIGGGNLVGPNAKAQWKDLPSVLAKAERGVVIYQITTYDWGTEDEQRQAYERLAEQTAEVDADLIFVSMPPIKPDDFYGPHMDELQHATKAARTAAENADHAEFLDASAVWGDEYSRQHDGTIDRSTDGIHTCPQGAARFTSWILGEIADRHPGFSPAESEKWANTGWSSDEAFHGC